MFVCSDANLRELSFRFLADLSRHLLRRGGNRSLLLFRGRAQHVLGKSVQLSFEMLAQARRRTVNRHADLIVERH